MEFTEVYRHEIIQSRRDRSRRALFWSRILGIVLIMTIAAVLRSEPDLRRALVIAGSDAVLAVAGHNAASAQTIARPDMPAAADDGTVQVGIRPRDRIKVNRPGTTDAPGTMAPEAPQQIDAEAMARAVERQLQNMSIGR